MVGWKVELPSGPRGRRFNSGLPDHFFRLDLKRLHWQEPLGSSGLRVHFLLISYCFRHTNHLASGSPLFESLCPSENTFES